MNTTINAVKFKASAELEKFVSDKVAKLDRLVDNATRCEVTLRVEKPESENNKVAEISIALPGQTLFVAQQADSFEQAVSQCADSMKVQIEKYKERYK
ncbi:MAG: ribosome-associated translation inhibitor RaiA [Bacteroidales bacterium]|nr:ribosome-associated translation inhibitor RaiA [Candidatus Colimorpha onthohippi]